VSALFPPDPSEIKHVVSYSGGAGSWAAAMRAAQVVPREQITLLFADAIIEDQDTYRFLIDSAASVFGVACPAELLERALQLPELSLDDPHCIDRKRQLAGLRADVMTAIPGLVWIADGRHPWEVCEDHRYIANSSAGLCSQHLKGRILDQWREDNCFPDASVIYLGIDWSESHRLKTTRAILSRWQVEAPMCERPCLSKQQMIDWMQQRGIDPPRAYRLGFPHNNCGGFCVKAGQAHFAHLLATHLNRYQWHEHWENRLRRQVGDYSMMKDRRGGTASPLTMRQLRERIEAGECFARGDWGGCGCALPMAIEALGVGDA
jgi:hypothetical protein